MFQLKDSVLGQADPCNKDLKGDTAMPLITLLVADALQQHPQKLENMEQGSH